ncbi:sulfite exporter TauE/SafE family protein [Paludibacterium paludis]|uniref:Probable membrane transporter protein n=1 Tax=Paludibacterium paludis TaxID=1225769 RepID=A0A918UAV9_9NEIS|nr:sulfite exporter TauE/SafE family protein [Paludibacterium paludis]GGY19106.1 UPF0721 transmembrane protein [Paludibacterium paludis]
MLTLLSLCLFSFLAGLIDAAVGGGGLIQIPALFTTLPREVPATLLGTNKFASAWGTLFATRSYLARVKVDWALILPAAASALVMAFAGAAVVSKVPTGWIRPFVLCTLIVIAVYTFRRKDFGSLHKPVVVGRRQQALALLLGGGIGFYDGLFGPGTGSFLIFLFVRVFGLDFLHASASAKVVNLATNIAALSFFVPAGRVLYGYAAMMACCNIAGSMVGTRLAVKGGARLIRWLFLCLTIVLIVKLAHDQWSLWAAASA